VFIYPHSLCSCVFLRASSCNEALLLPLILSLCSWDIELSLQTVKYTEQRTFLQNLQPLARPHGVTPGNEFITASVNYSTQPYTSTYRKCLSFGSLGFDCALDVFTISILPSCLSPLGALCCVVDIVSYCPFLIWVPMASHGNIRWRKLLSCGRDSLVGINLCSESFRPPPPHLPVNWWQQTMAPWPENGTPMMDGLYIRICFTFRRASRHVGVLTDFSVTNFSVIC
jgi:hypothetical protein